MDVARLGLTKNEASWDFLGYFVYQRVSTFPWLRRSDMMGEVMFLFLFLSTALFFFFSCLLFYGKSSPPTQRARA